MKRLAFLGLFLSLAAGAAPAAPAAARPAALSEHESLKAEIARLKTRKTVFALPPYLAEETDFAEACEKASEKGRKRVLVSIGREICTRCQRFYELVRCGEVPVDTNRVAFIRLNVDVPEQREYFLSTFEPQDSHLPFVGVTDGERSADSPCLTGRASVEDFRRLVRGAKP